MIRTENKTGEKPGDQAERNRLKGCSLLPSEKATVLRHSDENIRSRIANIKFRAHLGNLKKGKWYARNIAARELTKLAEQNPENEKLVENIVSAFVGILINNKRMNVLRTKAVLSLYDIARRHPERTEMVAHVLSDAMDDPNYDVGDCIVKTLAKLGRAALPVLICALESNNYIVRYRAIASYGIIGEENYDIASEVIQTLVPTLNDRNWQVKKNAATALGRIAKAHQEDSEIVRVITSALEDRYRKEHHGGVFNSISTALDQISELR